MRYLKPALAAFLILITFSIIRGQDSTYRPGQVFTVGTSALPSACTLGTIYIKTSAPATISICSIINTWTELATVGQLGVPSGSILLIDSGICPVGYLELSSLNGRTLVGTVAANFNVGSTGGNDNITPAGTNSSLTFTGSPLATHNHTFTANTHSHELPFQISSATQIRQIAAATFGTGTSRAATAQQNHTNNTTNAAVALSQSVVVTGNNAAITAGTPSGTINTPIFTGTSFDNRSAFTRVIFCQKT